MLKEKILDLALAVTDLVMALIPRPVPSQQLLENCRIVSHRGEHDNQTVLENTIKAFDLAVSEGVWGLETDIRWTADLVPMVAHDPDTARVFKSDVQISRVTFKQLREAVPDIPSLSEFIDRYGKSTHLMVELKAETFPKLDKQKTILAEHFSSLKPGDDYHILALDTDLFELFDIKPRSCCLPVAETNVSKLSRASLTNGYGGLTGHFLLLNDRLKKIHLEKKQYLGTGFIRSRNCLFREINRNVGWIFTNDAVKLQRIINSHLKNGT